MPRKVLIVDADAAFRGGIADAVNRDPGLTVCGQADDVFAALRVFHASAPHVVVTDVVLRQSSGIALIQRLHNLDPSLVILAYSGHDAKVFAVRALQAGSKEFVARRGPPEDLVREIHQAVAGRISCGRSVLMEIVAEALLASGDRVVSPVDRLSPREFDIFVMMGLGLRKTEIGMSLGLSMHTIETQYTSVKRKLGLRAVADVRREAVRLSRPFDAER
jgi:DNA-binding NarL/FixJ family response regulator